MMNKKIASLYSEIYNKGKLTQNIASKKEIKSLEEFYKNNFQSTEDYDEFIGEIGDKKRILDRSRAAISEFKKQFKKRQGLQPSILNECFVVQTIANLLNLNSFIDVDEKEENIPSKLMSSLLKAKEGELESQIPRYIYYRDDARIVLLQYGDSASIDSILINNCHRIRIEIKDSKAKLGEFDLSYGEDGKLIPSDKINDFYNGFLKFINKFNTETTVFKTIGHNYKFGADVDEKTAEEIIESTYNLKKIDLYLLQHGNKIFALPSKYLLDNIDISGSEIRTAGRNHSAVFTPVNLHETLMSLNAEINGNEVTLPYDARNETSGRGMTLITRYDINSLYFLKIGNVDIHAGSVKFGLDKIKQKKPTISIHVYTKMIKENLKTILDEINSK